MSKFGRFKFGNEEPTECYEGDYMTLEKSYVKILRGEPSVIDLIQTERLVVVIHLDKGQSVREIL